MKLILFNILIIFTVIVFSQSICGNKISIYCDEELLHSVLEKIETLSGVNFIYDDNLIKNIKISCQLENYSVENAVRKILRNYNISYKIYFGKYFVLFKSKKNIALNNQTVIINNCLPESNYAQAMIRPKVISNNKLEYPSEALENKIEGEVIVKFLINREGNVSKSFVEKSSGSNVLDSASVYYTYNLKFIPAQINGKAHHAWVSMKFKYCFVNNLPAANGIDVIK